MDVCLARAYSAPTNETPKLEVCKELYRIYVFKNAQLRRISHKKDESKKKTHHPKLLGLMYLLAD